MQWPNSILFADQWISVKSATGTIIIKKPPCHGADFASDMATGLKFHIKWTTFLHHNLPNMWIYENVCY